MDRNDLRQLTYAEFGAMLDRLTERVAHDLTARGGRVDVVAPILRSGAFTGMHLAAKLGVQQTLPLQYKHGKEGIERGFVPPMPIVALPEQPVIMLADTNTVTGAIATRAIVDLLTLYPRATILFATVVLDQAIRAIDGTAESFFALRSNESRRITDAEAKVRGITNECFVFPWENADEQWQEICAAETPRS